MTIRDTTRAQSPVAPHTWSQLDNRTRLILDGYGGEPVIAVRPSLVRVLRGNGNAAMVLSQLLFWSRRLGNQQGWFFQTQKRLAAQTGLGSHAQWKAVKLLVRIGVLETRRQGVPAKLYYRLNLHQLAALLLSDDQVAPVSDHSAKLHMTHGRKLDTDDGPQQDTGNGPRQRENRYKSKEIFSASALLADERLAPGATHCHSESLIDCSLTMSSNRIPEQMSRDNPASATTARPSQAASSAASDPVMDEPHHISRRGTTLRRRPATPIPDDFVVTVAMRAWAHERATLVNVVRETERFMNHAQGNDRHQVDWPAAWRNWMLRAQEFAEQDQRPVSRGGVVL